jgi:hypothetical protein
VQRLLTRAALTPKSPHRRLEIKAKGVTWYRAAMIQDESPDRLATDERGLEETRALFVKANYSWDDPLSPRSFAAWRKGLPSKRDQVFSIQDSTGKRQFYRLQTETPAGVLRMADLTLRADTLSPIKGAFHFEHQNDVTIQDAGEMTEPPRKVEAQNNHSLPRRALVKEVGPAEELRVFAALDGIGADLGESVNVDIAPSKQQVIVAGVGLSPDREQQIRQALAPLPNAQTRFTSGQPIGLVSRTPDTGTSLPIGSDAPLRHMLEQQAGGAQQFQVIADKSLDASSIILQRAHALYVLAEKFPPLVASQFSLPEQEMLRSLRHGHAIVIAQTSAELKDTLLPLLSAAGADETQSVPNTSWEVGAAQLYDQAKHLDASLGRILAGAYSQEAGQRIWSKLPDEIRRIEALALSQEDAR